MSTLLPSKLIDSALLDSLLCVMQKLNSSSSIQSDYLSALLSSIDESIVATNENFEIQYWNKGAEALFALRADEVLGKPTTAVVQFSFVVGTAEQARNILLSTGRWKGVVNFKDKSGNIRVLDASVTAAKNSAGRLIGYIGVHRDITEYDQTKTALSTFLSLMDAVDDDFLIVNKDLHITNISKKTNIKLKTLYGSNHVDEIFSIEELDTEAKPAIEDCIEKAFNGARIMQEFSISIASGQTVWTQANCFPLMNGKMEITHAAIVFRDITAQKEVAIINEKLYKSRLLFETFMENSPILSWITDQQGIIRYLNPQYLKTYGLGRNVLGKPLSDFFPQENATVFLQNDQKVINTNELLELTEKAITKDGKERIYHVVKFPWQVNNETYVGGWAIDITEETVLREALAVHLQKMEKSEKALTEALTKEQQLSDMKSRFVSMASHEFRTPLSTILSSIYLLEKYKTTEQHANRLRHTHRITESVHHMNALLEDFLSLGKLEDRKMQIAPSQFDIETLFHTIIEETELIKKERQIISYTHTGQKEINTDRKMLKNILTNLVSNACKFSQINASITIESCVKNRELTIRIIDHGIGISAEDQKHLFETFYRGKNATNIQGTGLGLHIVSRYIQLLNGKIEIVSVLEKGTMATVVLPIISSN